MDLLESGEHHDRLPQVHACYDGDDCDPKHRRQGQYVDGGLHNTRSETFGSSSKHWRTAKLYDEGSADEDREHQCGNDDANEHKERVPQYAEYALEGEPNQTQRIVRPCTVAQQFAAECRCPRTVDVVHVGLHVAVACDATTTLVPVGCNRLGSRAQRSIGPEEGNALRKLVGRGCGCREHDLGSIEFNEGS